MLFSRHKCSVFSKLNASANQKNAKKLNITFKSLGFFVAKSKSGKLNTSETGQSL